MNTATDDRHSKSLDDWYREASMTIQWNESAAVAARRFRDDDVPSLTVMADDQAIGQICLTDIERCESNGNWLGAVMVHHLMRRPHDSHN